MGNNVIMQRKSRLLTQMTEMMQAEYRENIVKISRKCRQVVNQTTFCFASVLLYFSLCNNYVGKGSNLEQNSTHFFTHSKFEACKRKAFSERTVGSLTAFGD